MDQTDQMYSIEFELLRLYKKMAEYRQYRFKSYEMKNRGIEKRPCEICKEPTDTTYVLTYELKEDTSSTETVEVVVCGKECFEYGCWKHGIA